MRKQIPEWQSHFLTWPKVKTDERYTSGSLVRAPWGELFFRYYGERSIDVLTKEESGYKFNKKLDKELE